MAPKNIRVADATEAIRKRATFVASHLSAGYVTAGPASRLGDLPEQYRPAWRDALNKAQATGTALYAVWSYDTPIAWAWCDYEAYAPPVRYSLTTTQHQYHARDGLGLPTPTWNDDTRAVPVGHYGQRGGGW